MNDIEPPPDGQSATSGQSAASQQSADNRPTGNRADRQAPPSPRGFSLASLFLLVTAAGVVAGLARNIGQTQTGSVVLLVHACIGAFLGMWAGALIGFGYPRRVSSILLGSFVGALTGGICAALAAAGGSPWLFFLGAVALLTLGFASRWIHRGL